MGPLSKARVSEGAGGRDTERERVGREVVDAAESDDFEAAGVAMAEASAEAEGEGEGEDAMVSLEQVLAGQRLHSARRSMAMAAGEVRSPIGRRGHSLPLPLPRVPTDRRTLLQSLRAFIALSPPRVRAAPRHMAGEGGGAAAVGCACSDMADDEDQCEDATWQLDLKEVLVGPQFAAGMSGSLFCGRWRGREAAVKILREGGGEEERRTLRKQFRQEVKVLSSLKHRNIVEFFGACQRNSVSCIVTEFLSGGTVRHFLMKQRGPLPFRTVVRMALDIARGMRYLHSQGFIHRDLKSDNLIISSEGVVKVMDFGVSRFTEDMEDMTAETGTYRWMAPEVMDSKPYSFSVDVYSFGIVLWELWTRELPFDGMTPLQAAYAVFNKGLRPCIPRGCPRVLGSLMEACWRAGPGERPDFAAVVRTLERMAQEQDAPSHNSQWSGVIVKRIQARGDAGEAREREAAQVLTVI